MTYRPDLVIYHAECMDGFTAAWVCARKWPGVLMHPGKYGEQYPCEGPLSVEGKHVLLVDFSYKKPVLEHMVTHHGAKSVAILDHHKSALEDLAGFTSVNPSDRKFREMVDLLPTWGESEDHAIPIIARFDMERSGAGMAWDFCHPGKERLRLAGYVEDRDIWRWALPNSREINAYIASYEFTLENWDLLAQTLDNTTGLTVAIVAGEAIDRKLHKDLSEMLPGLMRYAYVGGVHVPVANLPYTHASEGGNRLAQGEAFAATYFDDNEGYRRFSLRASAASNVDVSAIASQYGGGGHAKASGFRVKRGSVPLAGLSQELVL